MRRTRRRRNGNAHIHRCRRAHDDQDDDDFRVVGVTLDDTYATAYGYDDDGALVFAGDLALNRDAATGFLTNTVVGNVADTRAFNGFGEIVDYAVTASASSLYSATYTRDALGRVASQTETVGAATTEKVYDYDVRGRLASVKTDGVVTEWYAYDRNGNRTNSMNGAAVYDAQDRLLANASTTFAYNLNGSLTNRLPTAYSLQPSLTISSASSPPPPCRTDAPSVTTATP